MKRSNNISNHEVVEEQFKSKCMYCGSTSYGTGCIYSSHGRHIHSGDPGKCIYCGSLSYGSGCIYNPFNNTHVHGVDMASSMRESVRKTVEMSYIIDRLLQSNKDTQAYKLGLIDESGQLLRVPKDNYESNLISPLSKMLYRFKKFLPKDKDTLKESYKLLQEYDNIKEIKEDSTDVYRSKINFEKNINFLIKNLIHSLHENYNKISLEDMEKIIEDAILNNT